MQRGTVLLLILSLAGCGGRSGGSNSSLSATVTPTTIGPPEAPNCATPSTFAQSVTISGKAQYNARQIFGNASGGGLGSANPNDPAHPAAVNPIRYAEVQVTDAAGAIIQCAVTGVDGRFQLSLPQNSGTYILNVNSRSFPAPLLGAPTHVYGSVLSAPNTNTFYSLTTVVHSSGSADIGILTAAADGDLLGGAFNILDQLVNANDFLVNAVANCAATFDQCSNYDPSLHKVTVYWQKGFNPNDYFGPGGPGLSFYLPGYSRLFIAGGVSGDTDHSDTDHFDNSVIIHEYGHFLEENWMHSDSPGGAHNGNELLDPRLAWSEGWGDFIQAAVRGDNHYMDSIGNSDGQTELEYYIDTENVSPDSDYPRFPGEGNFRELAVTRLLWDAIDDTPNETGFGASDDISGKFMEIWAVLTKPQYGFRDPTFAFRNVSLIHQAQIYLQNHPGAGDAPASNWVNIRELNQHDSTGSHYAQYLVPSGGTETCAGSPSVLPTNTYLPIQPYYFSLTPATIPNDFGGLSTSDLFQNNRFYRLHIAASQVGSHTLQLVYEDDDGNPVVADLDLYLYDSQARFAVLSDMVSYSRSYPAGANPEQVLQYETITANLSAGDYLINVNVYVENNVGTTADFNLLLDGAVLCPGNLVPP